MQITLTIDKADVLAEVAQAAEYTGDKMTGDDGAYDRIRIVDGNQAELDRFWDEARVEVANALHEFMESEGMESDDKTYNVVLDMTSNFAQPMAHTMVISLKSFFVNFILSRWYQYTNKSESEAYMVMATAHLEDVVDKTFMRVRPSR